MIRDDRFHLIKLAACFFVLFLSGIPDSSVIPVLREVMVERYGVSTSAAHLFMCINLFGALLAVRLVGQLRQYISPGVLIGLASILNALLLCALAQPVGILVTLLLRMVEGLADLTVIAVLFAQVARIGSADSKGRRLGGAATCLMVGLASGIGIGGWVGGINPLWTFYVGALACGLAGIIAILVIRPAHLSIEESTNQPAIRKISPRSMIPVMAMMFGDRMLASLFVATLPLYFSGVLGIGPRESSSIIGMAMLCLAISAWPAGRFLEGKDVYLIRRHAGYLYASGMLILPFLAGSSFGGSVALAIIIGCCAGVLFASSLLVVDKQRMGSQGMAMYHLAGNCGFLFGAFFSAIALFGLSDNSHFVYLLIVGSLVVIHLMITTCTTTDIAQIFLRKAENRCAI